MSGGIYWTGIHCRAESISYDCHSRTGRLLIDVLTVVRARF
jgi:hypothetical protein